MTCMYYMWYIRLPMIILLQQLRKCNYYSQIGPREKRVKYQEGCFQSACISKEGISKRVTFSSRGLQLEEEAQWPGWGEAAQAEERARTNIWRQTMPQDNWGTKPRAVQLEPSEQGRLVTDEDGKTGQPTPCRPLKAREKEWLLFQMWWEVVNRCKAIGVG